MLDETEKDSIVNMICDYSEYKEVFDIFEKKEKYADRYIKRISYTVMYDEIYDVTLVLHDGNIK